MAIPPILVVVMAIAGAIAAGATAPSRPRIALAILFLIASLSSALLETPVGTMRPEMPAIVTVAAVLLARGRFRSRTGLPRTTLVMAVAFGTYLGVLALSSALIAPGQAQSLRMVAWLALSMLGGVVAFVLARARPAGAMEPLALAGAVMGAAGVIVAVTYVVGGPALSAGIQDPEGVLPRVKAFAWEANLYASFLGMCVFFALEAARGERRVTGLVALALMLIAFPLGVTRGAYIALAAGVVAYGVVRASAERRLADLPRLAAVAGVLLLVGFVASDLLLPNMAERQPAAAPTSTEGPDSSRPVSSRPASPTPRPAPTPTLAPVPDNLAFRLERVPIAIADLPESPLIGFGAESFGQRHPERSAGGLPDHIAILAVVVPYEAGIMGAGALFGGFAVLLISLWGAARRYSLVGDWGSVGAAAAFTGSLVSILVAYQGNNALHLAVNWIVIGAAAALTAGTARTDRAEQIG